MQLTARHSSKLQGSIPLEYMTGETPDISDYLDFGWYGRVRYKEDTGLGEIKIGRFIEPSHVVGSLMRYWILTASGILVLQTTVQHITYLETCTDAKKPRFKIFDDAIQERFHEKYDEATFSDEGSNKYTMEMWPELAENNKDFKEKFNKVFNNTYVNEADDGFTAYSYNEYVNMELTLY